MIMVLKDLGLGGFGKEKMSLPMYPGLPLRRNLRENWFKPIARIGEYGDDDYPLNPAEGAESNDKKLVSVIKARRDGRDIPFCQRCRAAGSRTPGNLSMETIPWEMPV